MHGTGANLALLRSGAQRAPGVDVGRETRFVDQHAVAAEHVGDEVVGEDRQTVEIGEGCDARECEFAGTICARL